MVPSVTLSVSFVRTHARAPNVWSEKKKTNKHGGGCRRILHMCKNVTGNIRTTIFFPSLHSSWFSRFHGDTSLIANIFSAADEWTILRIESNINKICKFFHLSVFFFFWWCVHCTANGRKSKVVFGFFDVRKNVWRKSDFFAFIVDDNFRQHSQVTYIFIELFMPSFRTFVILSLLFWLFI